MTVSIQQLAERQVEDLAQLTPGTYFAEPGSTLSIDEAYDVQERIVELRTLNGEKAGGYKLGCLGAKIRETFGMDGPICGRLFANEFHTSGVTLSCADYANLAIEGEMAVRISNDYGIESVFPVIELHHFVLRSDPPVLQELIVNNGINAGVVLPPRDSVLGRPKAGETIAIEINGQLLADAPLWGFPGGAEETLAWLTNHLKARDLKLKPGEIVLAGTLSGMYPVNPGDEVRVWVDKELEISLSLKS